MSDILKSIGEIVIAVGAVAITVFSWLSAQTAKEANKETMTGTTNALAAQLEQMLTPVNLVVGSVTNISNEMVGLVAQLSVVPQSLGHVRQDVAAVRTDLLTIAQDVSTLTDALN